MTGVRVGFVMCGSFCTFAKALVQMEELVKKGYEVIPIMSYNAYSTDTRFGKAEEHIKRIEELGYGNLPVCIAKTQYSLSDDDKNLLCDNEYNIHVRDVILKSGAGFIVVLAGKIMTMPGLPKAPAAESIDIDEDGNIVGIF